MVFIDCLNGDYVFLVIICKLFTTIKKSSCNAEFTFMFYIIIKQMTLCYNLKSHFSELASTLRMFDISASEDMDMVAQIKREVKKLCTRNIIATQITLNEMDDDRRDNLARMIYESEKEVKVENMLRVRCYLY